MNALTRIGNGDVEISVVRTKHIIGKAAVLV